MTEPIAQNRSQVLAAKRWMDDEAGMERASLGPAEYVAYRMKVSPADADALVAAVYALEEGKLSSRRVLLRRAIRPSIQSACRRACLERPYPPPPRRGAARGGDASIGR